MRQTMLGQIVSASVCRTCSRQAGVSSSPCDCSGDGRVVTDETYTVDVPAADAGATLRLTGRGAVGPRGGPAGDLYVKVSVAPHDRFVRPGSIWCTTCRCTMTQATLGHHIAYETLDGDEDLVIPRGTQSGRVFRLKGRGVRISAGEVVATCWSTPSSGEPRPMFVRRRSSCSTIRQSSTATRSPLLTAGSSHASAAHSSELTT